MTAKHCDLTFLLKKIDHLKQLQNIVEPYLAPHLRTHCQVANMSDGCLILVVSNAALATELRWQSQELLNLLKKISPFEALTNIKIKVRLPTLPPRFAEKLPEKRHLSTATCELIRDYAEQLGDEDLKAVMKRIADHGQKD